MRRIIIIRELGRFIVHFLDGARTIERVTAQNAQLVMDYLNAAWPPGTRAQWFIL